MTSSKRTIQNIFVWSYERGTLQYDIICALILAFIFFVPPSCFVSKGNGKMIQSNQSNSVSSQKTKAAESR